MRQELIRTFKKASHEYGIFLMDNKSREQQLLFLESFYKSFGLKNWLDQKWFDWFYVKNPLGQCNCYILLDLTSNLWIGGFGFAKKGYSERGVTKNGGLAVNGFINPGHEGLGLYTELISTGLAEEHYFDTGAFSFPYSKNIASIKGHLKSGFRHSIKLSFLELKLASQVRDDSGVLHYCDLSQLAEFEFDSATALSEINFNRTHRDLLWRYAERPDRQYQYLGIRSGGEYGYMILGQYRNSNGEKRCEIADYRHSSQEILQRLVRKAKFVAVNHKYDYLDVLVNPDSSCAGMFQIEHLKPRGDGYDLLTFRETPFDLPNNMEINYGDFDVV